MGSHNVPPRVSLVPYRPLTIAAPDSPPATFWVRVSDEAVASWLTERPRLRATGYPQGPPDVDAPHLRAWLPRFGDENIRRCIGRRPGILTMTGSASWSSPPSGTAATDP